MAWEKTYLKIYNSEDHARLKEFDRSEIMRYAGMFNKGHAEGVTEEALSDMMDIMESCIKEVTPILSYKVSFCFDDIEWVDDKPILSFDTYDSKDLAKNLKGCIKATLFAATIGIGIDRLITKYSRISPAKALFLQAIGAERIEALCDTFNEEIMLECRDRGETTNRRFSPGYGDLPLEVQKEFMVLLDCSRRIGVTLNESLLMTPSKSVTAIIGISTFDGENLKDLPCNGVSDPKARLTITHDCKLCSNIKCEYRK